MKGKSITIDGLARMVQKGFDETAKKDEMNARFEEVNQHFKEVDQRFDKIEKLILADYKRRIEKLELEVREVRDLLAIK